MNFANNVVCQRVIPILGNVNLLKHVHFYGICANKPWLK